MEGKRKNKNCYYAGKNPTTGLRLLANNLDPRDYTTTAVNGSVNVVTGANERTTSQSFGPSYTNWQLRLELKL